MLHVSFLQTKTKGIRNREGYSTSSLPDQAYRLSTAYSVYTSTIKYASNVSNGSIGLADVSTQSGVGSGEMVAEDIRHGSRLRDLCDVITVATPPI